MVRQNMDRENLMKTYQGHRDEVNVWEVWEVLKLFARP
jgi:hypothetical protein